MGWPARILHVIDRVDGYGGSRMLRHLAGCQTAAGARVTVATLAADKPALNPLRQAGVDVHVTPGRGLWDVLAIARWSRAAGVESDVVHAWNPLASVATAIAGRDVRNTASVATVGPVSRRQWWAETALKWRGRRVDAFAASDERARNWLEGLGVSNDLITVIRRGVAQPPPPTRDRASLLAEMAIPASVPLIAVAAPLVRSKALDETIWCFELVRVLYPEARLLIMGDGPDRARLERFASQVSESGFVRFLGFRDDLSDILQHVDVYWQLSASATTPWTLLEAMAAATPVVAADVAAHREILPADQSSWLTPLRGRAEVARASVHILQEPNQSRRTARNAAATVLANWSLEAALNSYQELYRLAIERVATPR